MKRSRDTRPERSRPDAGSGSHPGGSGRLSAAALIECLVREPAPPTFRDLLALTGSFDALARKHLRLLVRGMVRTGELIEDLQGRFHVAARTGRDSAALVGVLESSGRDLTFAGVAVERTRGMRLRPGDRVEAVVQGDRASILRVLAYAERPIVGELRIRGREAWVDSLSPDYRGRVALDGPPAQGADGNTVTVRVVGEDRDGLVGEVSGVLSTRAGAAHAAETLLASHGVPVEWPEAVLRAAARLPKQVQPHRHRDRRSLVDVPLVTIDGETAKDFDDAVYAERQRGGWRLVVAIADVAHYVKAGAPLDQSAWERGTSVYLPDRVIPMLPEALSNGLCSLRPHEPRLALVCEMRVTPRGNVTKFEFYEAVIRSWQRLTYTRVQEFLDAGALDVEAPVQASLRELKAVYDVLRSAREARGALDFDTHEAALELHDGHVSAIHPVSRLDAHRLIEEAMIAANVCAARFLEGAGRPGMYRVHEPPDRDKSEQLRQALAYAGIRLGKGEFTPKLVHEALSGLGERPDRWIFEMLALRAMTQAVYSPANKGHFGLALERYMHFTSPIRRYADLVVHRAIKATLHGADAGMSDDWLVATGQHISMAERRAESVGWGVEGWLKCEYIAGRIGEEFDGVVMGVTDFGLFVELTGFYVQGLLHISELGADYFRYSSTGMSLVGDRSGRRFGLGDRLRVRLVDVQPALGKVDLLLAGTAKSSADRGKSERSNGRHEKGGRQEKGGKRSGRRR
ncbi:MAG: ribonuclease R [Pseudomonadales bacterium]|nr:ribonuclease R [Pseudomonadales bacterium]